MVVTDTVKRVCKAMPSAFSEKVTTIDDELPSDNIDEPESIQSSGESDYSPEYEPTTAADIAVPSSFIDELIFCKPTRKAEDKTQPPPKKATPCTTGDAWESLKERQPGKGLTFIYAFSGPPDRPDGIAHFVLELGAEVDCFDNKYGGRLDGGLIDKDKCDLLDDDYWDPVERRLVGGHYHGGMMSPPCRTMSTLRERSMKDGGPRVLRGPEPPELYGFTYLKPWEKEQVRCDNLLFARTGRMADLFLDHGPTSRPDGVLLWLPWLIEQPLRKKGKPHAFNLKYISHLADHQAVNDEDIAQCNAQAITEKPTSLRGTFKTNIPRVCRHQPRWWTEPWSGYSYHSPHRKLYGRQWHIPWEDWKESMLEYREPPGEFISDSTAAYPEKMNKIIALGLVLNAAQYQAAKLRNSTKPMIESGKWHNSIMKSSNFRPEWNHRNVIMKPSVSLRDAQVFADSAREAADKRAVGGLRHPLKGIKVLKGHQEVGPIMAQALNDFLQNNPNIEKRCLDSIGADKEDLGPTEEQVDDARKLMAKVLDCNDIKAVQNEICQTELRAGLLGSWGKRARDPAQIVEKWCREGAPGGIEVMAPNDGLFPSADSDSQMPGLHELHADHDAFTNYRGFDDDDMANDELTSFVDKGMLREFDTYEECKAYLKGEPVESRFGVLERYKDGKLKRRVILDQKMSDITKHTRRTHRLLLPRLTDVIHDTLDLSNELQNDELVEHFIIDIKDAFWLIPNHPQERRYCVGRRRGKWIVYVRTPQGSRGAPFSWGYVFSLVARCTQSLFPSSRLRLHVYVDDPLAIVRGPANIRNRCIAIIIITWRALGFGLAYSKSMRGQKVVWIGHQIDISAEAVAITIKDSRTQEMEEMTLKLEKQNVTPFKELRSYTGKASSFASVLEPWRPFVQDLYGVLYSKDKEKSKAPPNCAWTAQFAHVLRWIKAFLFQQKGTLIRTFRIDAHFGRGDSVQMILDASPWGLGGILKINSVVVSWYGSALTEHDSRISKHKLGDANGQQTWESLNVLVALRTWKEHWMGVKAVLEVRSDNVTALTLLCKLKGSSPSLNIVAREVALDMGDCAYKPQIITHVPGIAIKSADTLSRRYQPRTPLFKLPEFLRDGQEAHLPKRDEKYYKALNPPKVRLVPRELAQARMREA